MSFENMFQKAMELQNIGALNEARDIYEKLLLINPNNSDIWNLLGCIAQSKREDEKAIDCFLKAIEYSVKPFGMYYFNLSLSYKSLGLKTEAVEAMDRAVFLMNDVKEIWNFKGVLEAECSNILEAVKCFSKALELDNNYREARANLCYYTGDKDRLFKLSLEDEGDFSAHFLSGKIVDDLELKEKYFLRALSVDNTRSDLLLCIADVLKKLNRESEALIYYFKVLNLEENNVEAICGVADIYLSFKDYEKALKYYEKSFLIRRDIAGVYLNYGIALYELNRNSAALEAYRNALKLEPNNAKLCYNLALILKDVDEKEEALGLMFNAFLKEKDNNTFVIGIMESLVELYESNPEMALKIAQNWQKLDENNIFVLRILKGMTKGEDVKNDILYAKILFDEFSLVYDKKITEIESKIIDEFKKIKGNISGKVLDLGCGTGKFGEALIGENVELFGVDVSGKMIEIAQRKGCYKELFLDDIESFLSRNDVNLYDLIVSFDVFSYIGDLENIIEKLQGKEVWFTVEKADDTIGSDFYLEANGRYKHQEQYIRKIANKFKFNDIEFFERNLRLENGEPVLGFLIKLK